ncbi:potassium-transporting ATPase subunit KdpA [Fluviispira multicolorata]|uniref:Potassium-transporting ATPase potassium-binding subunit n=1 Tax=Fluviispira multicolorata TaxID=2654512 RepID=A0A833JF25_9BACT|nr:potassium-transporting ATPase subunit KdpA [Fluviispira multicolorata]KAB8033509.1 potassium-transporting ATPase subunit KdpA [Fluviispira multicolorata]
MNAHDFLFLFLFLFMFILFILSYPLGNFIFKVMNGEKTFLHYFLLPIEKRIYKIAKIDSDESQSWQKYSLDIIIFSAFLFALTFFILKFQHIFPLNPQNFPGLPTDLAFNTAVSFLTNTNWQAYSGETTMSYFSQMVALSSNNFLSAAIGLAACIAIIRGLVQEKSVGLGCFWVDLCRSTLYILLPLSLIFAIFYISQGIIQNFLAYIHVKTLEGVEQILPQGPVASQVAIKLLGVNGGGFFNANAAHPYENPTALSHFFQMISIFLIPSALVFTFGKMANYMKHAFAIWISMTILFLASAILVAYFEYQGNPNFIDTLGLSSSINMEGKEARFGIFSSSLFTSVTTAASCGAVANSHSSLTPLGGMFALINMLLNEVIFGGVGSGLYGMILFIILAVFIAGLMIGRTPEYLGKKIEERDIKIAIIPVISVSFVILVLLAISSMVQSGFSSIGNPGPHGFTEMLYAYTSSAQNNGSAFGSLNANTPFWNYTTSIAMLAGRYLNLIPLLAIAGSLIQKKKKPITENSFKIDGFLFISLLIGTILILGLLVYLPSLSLGPIMEYLQMTNGKIIEIGGK